MKLLCIQASSLLPDGRVFRPTCWPDPGVALPLLAALTPSDLDVEIVDDFYEDASAERPCDLVAISAMTAMAATFCCKARGSTLSIVSAAL